MPACAAPAGTGASKPAGTAATPGPAADGSSGAVGGGSVVPLSGGAGVVVVDGTAGIAGMAGTGTGAKPPMTRFPPGMTMTPPPFMTNAPWPPAPPKGSDRQAPSCQTSTLVVPIDEWSISPVAGTAALSGSVN